MTPRHWALLATILWALLQLPRLAVHYSFDWDASQYARGAIDFNLDQHQPQPPGYPLHVMALRALLPLTNPARGQVLLSLAYTLAALWAFRRWTASNPATLLLAFSPVVFFYGATQSTYPIDLLSGSLLGWLAWRVTQGEHHLAVPLAGAAALLAGFRQSGVTFLAPMIAYALWQTPWRRRIQAAAIAAAGLLAWLVPLALSTGGFAHLRQLNSSLAQQNVGTTSILLGAPARAQFFNFTDAVIYLAVALCGFAVCQWPRPAVAATRWRFALLAAGPGLLFAFAFHCPKAGYLAVALPALAWALAPRIQWKTAGLGLALSLAVSWFPFELIPRGPAPGFIDAVSRFLPRRSGLIEESNAEVARLLTQLPAEEPITVLIQTPEAPNWRTLTFDFPARRWQTTGGQTWLTDARQPSPSPTARRLGGGYLFTLWTDVPRKTTE
jgi:hypothetical protein